MRPGLCLESRSELVNSHPIDVPTAVDYFEKQIKLYLCDDSVFITIIAFLQHRTKNSLTLSGKLKFTETDPIQQLCDCYSSCEPINAYQDSPEDICARTSAR